MFGGTIGPNPEKPVNNETQYYEGIKVRAQALVINVQSSTTQVTNLAAMSPTTASKVVVARRKPPSSSLPDTDALLPQPTASPASILKAQLSAPPKPRECAAVSAKADIAKSQVNATLHILFSLLNVLQTLHHFISVTLSFHVSSVVSFSILLILYAYYLG